MSTGTTPQRVAEHKLLFGSVWLLGAQINAGHGLEGLVLEDMATLAGEVKGERPRVSLGSLPIKPRLGLYRQRMDQNGGFQPAISAITRFAAIRLTFL